MGTYRAIRGKVVRETGFRSAVPSIVEELGKKPYFPPILGKKPYFPPILGKKPYFPPILGKKPYFLQVLGKIPYFLQVLGKIRTSCIFPMNMRKKWPGCIFLMGF
jgi:hypothetical protein